jgi:hypothetical protein
MSAAGDAVDKCGCVRIDLSNPSHEAAMANAALLNLLAVCALPAPAIKALADYCEASGEAPIDVLTDALVLHLDGAGELIDDTDVIAYLADHGADAATKRTS